MYYKLHTTALLKWVSLLRRMVKQHGYKGLYFKKIDRKLVGRNQGVLILRNDIYFPDPIFPQKMISSFVISTVVTLFFVRKRKRYLVWEILLLTLGKEKLRPRNRCVFAGNSWVSDFLFCSVVGFRKKKKILILFELF